MVEILAEYGHQKGLDAREAQEIVAQVMQGAGKMINETGKSPAELLQAVSTPGGCTLAGLNKLDELEMTKILEDVIQKTIEVAKNLGK